MRLAVAVDLGESGGAASVIAQAAEWVVAVGGTLDGLYVGGAQVDIPWLTDAAVRAVIEVEGAQRRRAEAARLATLLEAVPAAHRGAARLLLGEPVAALVDAAGDYDALLVATHGRSGMRQFWMGSVAEAVVRRAPCPVVMLRMIDP